MLVAASVLVAVADGRYNTYHCSTSACCTRERGSAHTPAPRHEARRENVWHAQVPRSTTKRCASASPQEGGRLGTGECTHRGRHIVAESTVGCRRRRRPLQLQRQGSFHVFLPPHHILANLVELHADTHPHARTVSVILPLQRKSGGEQQRQQAPRRGRDPRATDRRVHQRTCGVLKLNCTASTAQTRPATARRGHCQ
jgi:hypothetical protein